MAKCPVCGANLGPSDLLALKCLSCGESLAELAESDQANRAMRTLDESLPAEPDGLRTIDDSVAAPGVATGTAESPGMGTIAETPTADEQALSRTLPEQAGPLPAGPAVDRTIDESSMPTLDVQTPQQTIPEGASLPPIGGATLAETPTSGPALDRTLDSGEFPPILGGEQEAAAPKDPRTDQTLDSGAFAPVALPPEDHRATVPEARLDQTLDSAEFGPASPSDGGGTVHGPRLDQTLDSGNFPQAPVPGTGTVGEAPGGATIPEGAVGPAGEKEGGTVHDRRIDATLDSAELASAVQGEERKTVGERAVAQTLDSVDSVSGLAEEPKTIAERRHAATIDSAELASADLVKVSQMWEGSYGQKDTPMTSLKAKSPPTEVPENTLNVALRVFRGAGVKSTRTADYDLIKQLGEGGMGIVYKARQASIDRTVAIKTLKPKTAKDKTQRDKFLAEAVVTGELDHPNIVPIYDLGANEEGALFYSMKMVQGTPWMDEIKKKSLAANIEILMKVADAIAFAHSRDVVHRDLKPENIMLGGFGEVLVMDWGLAIYTTRAKRPGGIKQSVSMGGTPAYMAPEMASGPFERICPQSDVYLLGAILYEMVTGKPPHTGADVMKCLFAAAKNQIQPTEVKSELVDIALKAMATSIEERYATVQAFQDAIREYLSHSESIVLSTQADEDLSRARKTNDYQDFAEARFGFEKALEMWGGNERARAGFSEANLAYATSALNKGDYDLGLSLLDAANPKHSEILNQIQVAQKEREARQHRLKTMRRALIGGVAVFFVTVTGALCAITYAMIDANKQRAIAVKQKDEADTAKIKAQEAEADAVQQKLAADEAAEKARKAEAEALVQKDAADMAKNDAVAQRDAADKAKNEAVAAQKEAEYQEYIAVIGLAAAKIDENAHGRALEMLERYKDRPDLINWEWGRLMRLCKQNVADFTAGDKLEAVAFDSRGERFVAGGWNGKVYIWSVKGGMPVVIDTGASRITAVAFSPKEDVVATGGDHEQAYIRLWNAATGEPLEKELKDAGFVGHTGPVLSLSFSRDGQRLLSSSADGTARLWNVAEKAPLKTYSGHIDPVQNAVFSPNEQKFVTVSDDGTALVWNVQTGEKSPPFYGHEGPVYAAAFSPDGERIATGGYDKRVLVWNPAELKPFDYKRHSEEYRRRLEEFRGKNPDGDIAASGLLKFKMPLSQKVAELTAHTDRVQAVRFSEDGKFLFSAGHDNAINVWDANRAWTEGSKSLLKTLRGHDSPVRACAVTGDGSLVLSGSYDGKAKLWDVRRYEEVRVLLGRGPHHAEEVLAASFSGEGEDMRIVTASHDRTAKVWRLDAAQKEAALIEEKRFIEERTFVEGHEFLASTALFLEGGKKLITGGIDQSARIWDVATGTELRKLKGTGGNAVAAVSPDGKWILTGANSNDALLWQAAGDEPPLALQGHRAPVTAIAFSPDGKYIYTGDKNGTGRLWNAARLAEDPPQIEPLGPELKGHAASIMAAAFLPDGSRLLTASGDNHVGQWDLTVSPPARTRQTLIHPKGVKSLALSKSGKYALTSSEDNWVRLWDVEQAKTLKTFSVPSAARDDRGPAARERLGSVGSVAFSHDDLRGIFVADEDRSVRVFAIDPASNAPAQILLTLESEDVYVRSAIFTPDDSAVLTVGGNEARLWDAKAPVAGPPHERMRFSPHDVVASASFSPDRKHIVTASWDYTARIWSTETGLDEKQLKGHTDHVNSALFSPDGKYVLTSSDDRTARLWDVASGQVLVVFGGHGGAVRWAAFSEDGKRVLTASADKVARLWDAELKAPPAEIKEPITLDKPLGVFAGHQAEVLHAGFSKDGAHVVTGSKDNTARIWDAATFEEVKSLLGHTAGVNSVAFSPDGKRVLTGSEDFTAKIWDSEKGQEVLTLRGHEREVTSVAFSADGIYALTGSRDNKAIVWTANDWKKAAEAVAATAPAFDASARASVAK